MSGTQLQLATDSAWSRWWFCATDVRGSLRIVRVGLAVLAFWYFASHWNDLVLWLGGEGILASESLARFLQDAELGNLVRWRLSPLYWIDSPLLLRGFLIVAMGLAVASVLVRRTRGVQVALWLAVVWLANRVLMLAGLEELALAFGLGYLAIAPADDAPHWSGSLALRLIQAHVTLLLAVTGLTMLSALAWWDGNAVMALVAPVELRYIDWVDRLSTPWVHAGLTHLIVLVAVLAPVLLWIGATRRVACVAATLWCVGLALLSSQLLYFATIGVLLQTFWQAEGRGVEAAPR